MAVLSKRMQSHHVRSYSVLMYPQKIPCLLTAPLPGLVHREWPLPPLSGHELIERKLPLKYLEHKLFGNTRGIATL